MASCSVRRIASSSAGFTETADAVELGVAANRGERGPQLVRDVGDEASEPLLRSGALVEGALDPSEHLVERDGELTRLGARRAFGHVYREVALGDLRGGLRHLLHRPDADVDHPPTDEPERSENGERAEDLDEHQ